MLKANFPSQQNKIGIIELRSLMRMVHVRMYGHLGSRTYPGTGDTLNSHHPLRICMCTSCTTCPTARVNALQRGSKKSQKPFFFSFFTCRSCCCCWHAFFHIPLPEYRLPSPSPSPIPPPSVDAWTLLQLTLCVHNARGEGNDARLRACTRTQAFLFGTVSSSLSFTSWIETDSGVSRGLTTLSAAPPSPPFPSPSPPPTPRPRPRPSSSPSLSPKQRQRFELKKFPQSLSEPWTLKNWSPSHWTSSAGRRRSTF